MNLRSKCKSGPGAGGPTCDKSGSGAKKFHHQTLPVPLPQTPPDLAGAWLLVNWDSQAFIVKGRKQEGCAET